MLGRKPPSKLRTLLILGRASNLPTVWSNCLAGWWLGGGGTWLSLAWVCFGVTFLYLGGMFLNDAFDTDFDQRHRPMRPIPSGKVTEKYVWQWGFGCLLTGCLCLIWMSSLTAALVLGLSLCILIYDAVHKFVPFAPVLIAACRLLIYLVAASVAANGVTGLVLWSAIALACYIIGLSYLARRERVRRAVQPWPMLFLTGPVLLALLVNDGPYRAIGFVLSAIVVIWVLWAVRHAFWRSHPNIIFSVSRLLAGIALVDLLAVADVAQPAVWLFLACFFLALLLQRFVPAT
jgi:UbiA prenyltransferase family